MCARGRSLFQGRGRAAIVASWVQLGWWIFGLIGRGRRKKKDDDNDKKERRETKKKQRPRFERPRFRGPRAARRKGVGRGEEASREPREGSAERNGHRAGGTKTRVRARRAGALERVWGARLGEESN